MRNPLNAAVPAALFAASLALTGCATATETAPAPTESHATAPTASGTPTTSAPATQVIEITVKDGKVSPSGKSVAVKVGKPITLRVTADTAGELHVHTDPEHSLAYTPGVTTLDFTIDRPGVFEVEDHHTDVLVVNLEAR